MVTKSLIQTGRRLAELLHQIRNETDNADGWIAMCHALESALIDPRISSSRQAVAYLNLVLYIAAEGKFMCVGGMTVLPLAPLRG